MRGLVPPELPEVSGVIHVHSTYSDGSEPVPAIVEAASRAGVDFLLLTDHDTLAALHELGEQWHKETLLLVGCEITPRHNHFLAYGLTGTISPHLPPAEYTEAVLAQGGIGFLAHPFEDGSRILGQNSYSWEDWSVTAYTGIEIWNYFSEWVGSCSSIPRTVRAVTNWKAAVFAPDSRTVAKWDELGLSRRVTGIGGMDAHGVKKTLMGRDLALHPYERSFRAVRTHLLLTEPFTGQVRDDRARVMEALREGRAFVANHEEGDPRGFTFFGRTGGEWLLMGQEVTTSGQGQVHFSVRVPGNELGATRPTLRLMKDGKVIAETPDWDLQAVDQGPGVYRVEVWHGQRAWIFSNPIYLRGGPEA